MERSQKKTTEAPQVAKPASRTRTQPLMDLPFSGAETPAVLVTSDRISSRAKVKNSFFPKIRSWFILGGPIELLSPLSVARVLASLGAIAGFLALITSSEGTLEEAIGWCAITVAVILLLWLSLARALSNTTLKVFLALTLLTSAGLAFALAPTLLVLLPLGWALIATVAMSLFMNLKSVILASLAVTVLSGLALGAHGEAGAAVGAGLGVGIASLGLGLLMTLAGQAIRRQGTIDPDTGIPNSAGMADLANRLARKLHIAAVGIVIPRIAEVRDALGHEVGTDLLRRVVEDLGQVIPSGVRIGRVSGDDLVALAATASEENLQELGLSVSDAIVKGMAAGKYRAKTIDIQLRAHTGVVSGMQGIPPQEAIRRALVSAHESARLSRPVLLWSGEGGRMTAKELILLDALSQATKSGNLWLAYQPQIDASTGQVCGAEALLRWEHPPDGLISPGIFIPLAEKTGLVEEITRWVLNEALDAIVRWRADGIEVPISVNFSAKSLSDPMLPERVLSALACRDLPSQAICVEVTETAETSDLARAIELLQPLHDAGVRISIDDFGAGYTSLGLLPELPVDEIKIDQKFVLKMMSCEADRAIVEAVAALGHRIGLTVVAEGVEDEAIAKQVVDYGCDVLQGYWFAKPMPESEWLTWLQTPVKQLH